MIRDLFDLTGKTALVTGGSKGIGKSLARGLAEAGADVVISSRHEDELRAASSAIAEGLSIRVAHVVADLSRRGEADRLAADALAAFGKIDILINNAGSNCPQPIDELKDEDWDRIHELNLASCMALTRALAPGMKARRWGRIVNISSILGMASAAGRSTYSSSKSGLIGLTQANAADLGPFGVTVNAIAPGPFVTELTAAMLPPETRDALGKRTALGRWGETHELIGPTLMLASDAGSYITGATIVVDGGILARVW